MATLVTKTRTLLSKQAALAMAHYLTKRYTVSTAAHHDFATHPFFANYLIAAGYANKDAGLTIVPVLSCAGISLNNSSFPRGLLLHDEHLNSQRIKVVSLKNHHHPVYGYPGYRLEALTPKIPAELAALTNRILGDKKTAKNPLSDQITVAVRAMTKMFPGFEPIEVAYLPQEEIAATLFLKYHLTSKTIMHRLVFEATVRNLFIKKFNGIIGAHDTEKKTGSHLFWGISDSGRVSLFVKQNTLTSTDGSFSIPLTPHTIRKALLSKKIMPTMSLTLSLLSFYYGLACAGGFSQVGYLTDMKKAYLEILEELGGLATEHAIATAVPTDLFSGEFVLATLGEQKVAATAIDIIRNPHLFTEASLRRAMRSVTLQKAADRMMPELYKIIASIPSHDR